MVEGSPTGGEEPPLSRPGEAQEKTDEQQQFYSLQEYRLLEKELTKFGPLRTGDGSIPGVLPGFQQGILSAAIQGFACDYVGRALAGTTGTPPTEMFAAKLENTMDGRWIAHVLRAYGFDVIIMLRANPGGLRDDIRETFHWRIPKKGLTAEPLASGESAS